PPRSTLFPYTTLFRSEATPAHAQSFRPMLIALIVAAAFFMETLDGTVIATALPSMAQSFGVGAIQLSIGITAYMLTLAIFIPARSEERRVGKECSAQW